MDRVEGLRPGVNFINVFSVLFALIFFRKKISNPKHSFVIFGAKILYEKLAHIMLMKLTAGVFSSTFYV